jgi:hypothetical protein
MLYRHSQGRMPDGCLNGSVQGGRLCPPGIQRLAWCHATRPLDALTLIPPLQAEGAADSLPGFATDEDGVWPGLTVDLENRDESPSAIDRDILLQVRPCRMLTIQAASRPTLRCVDRV